MRFVLSLYIFVILHESVYSGCSTWTERMKKYGDLVQCQYYVTSEANFNHYIPYVNTTDPNSEHLISLKFFSLAQQTIKVKLAASNDSTPIDTTEYSGSDPNRMESSTDHEYYENRNGYAYDRYGNRMGPITTTTEKPITYVAKGRTETHRNDVAYEIVISAPETYIQTDMKRIRNLRTPDIVRDDEPNEVLINIFKDGQLKVAVNGIEALHTRVEFANDLKFFSFASSGNFKREEYFYNCA